MGVPAATTGVREVNAERLDSEESLRAILAEGPTEPVLLRGAPFSRQASGFTVGALVEELGEMRLPRIAAKRGRRAASGCAFAINAQGGAEVMGASPAQWNPDGCSFGSFLQGLSQGSGHYLRTRSGNTACRRTPAPRDELVYGSPEDEDDPDDYDAVVKALVPRVPFPLALPRDRGFRVAFWIGATGNNIGLHTDLYAEQLLVQHEGVKEVLLLLPSDASVLAPFPFLSSPFWFKSERRSVANLNLRGERCLRAELRPGDMLYMPPWWWHEVRTISPGVSVSTTFRFHTDDADRMSRVMNDLFFIHKHAQERPCDRLARHLRSFFLRGLLHAEAEAAAVAEARHADGTTPCATCSGCCCSATAEESSMPSFVLWAGLVAACTAGLLMGRRCPAA